LGILYVIIEHDSVVGHVAGNLYRVLLSMVIWSDRRSQNYNLWIATFRS